MRELNVILANIHPRTIIIINLNDSHVIAHIHSFIITGNGDNKHLSTVLWYQVINCGNIDTDGHRTRGGEHTLHTNIGIEVLNSCYILTEDKNDH